MEKKVNCLILVKNKYETNSTDFIEAIKMLLSNGVNVKIVIGNSEGELDSFYFDNKVEVEILSKNIFVNESKIKRVLQENRFFYYLSLKLYLVIKNLYSFLKFYISKNKKEYVYNHFLNKEMVEYKPDKQYDCIWVHDEYGLLWAEKIMNRDNKIPVIYHCIELYWEHFLNKKKRKISKLEDFILFENALRMLKRVELIVIQDSKRWDVLCEFTGVNNIQHVYLPVSIYDYPISSSIPVQEKVIYYPTYLSEKRGCSALVDVFTKLDTKGFELEIHGIHADYAYLVQLKRMKMTSNIVISNKGLSYSELLEKHQKIWCVFIYYGEADNNDKYVVNSSNKLAMALQAGKPIISIGNKGINELCEKYQCGIVIQEWKEKELLKALVEMEQNYEQYCANARKCYEQRYDIALYEENVIKSILEVIK